MWLKQVKSMQKTGSSPEVFWKKGALRNLAKFTGKHLSQVLFFHLSLRPAAFLKKRLWHRYFAVNFAKFLGTPILQNTSDCYVSVQNLPAVGLMELIWKLKDLHSDDCVLQEPNLSIIFVICWNSWKKKLNCFNFTIFIITNWPT